MCVEFKIKLPTVNSPTALFISKSEKFVRWHPRSNWILLLNPRTLRRVLESTTSISSRGTRLTHPTNSRQQNIYYHHRNGNMFIVHMFLCEREPYYYPKWLWLYSVCGFITSKLRSPINTTTTVELACEGNLFSKYCEVKYRIFIVARTHGSKVEQNWFEFKSSNREDIHTAISIPQWGRAEKINQR